MYKMVKLDKYNLAKELLIKANYTMILERSDGGYGDLESYWLNPANGIPLRLVSTGGQMLHASMSP